MVAVRADLNVPLSKGGVAEDTRIRASLPTVAALADAGARVAVLSHLGRPNGRVCRDLSLRPVARRLGGLLACPVAFSSHVAGPPARDAVSRLRNGSVLVLENTRFLPGEASNDPALAADWAGWADRFVLDAFGTAHRAHASTDGLPRAVRARGGAAAAGLLVEKELAALNGVAERPRRPFVAVLGGAKVSDKLEVVEALLSRADALLVGGAMANTFFLAMGLETGSSLVEPGLAATALRLMDQGGARLALPVDCVVASELAANARTRVVERSGVRAGEAIADVGPATTDVFGSRLASANTVFWNGPMGVFEVPGMDAGTFGVARAVASAAARDAAVVVGGGDSVAAATAAGVASRIGHVSTGGGASLDLLAGKELPGIAALSETVACPS